MTLKDCGTWPFLGWDIGDCYSSDCQRLSPSTLTCFHFPDFSHLLSLNLCSPLHPSSSLLVCLFPSWEIIWSPLFLPASGLLPGPGFLLPWKDFCLFACLSCCHKIIQFFFFGKWLSIFSKDCMNNKSLSDSFLHGSSFYRRSRPIYSDKFMNWHNIILHT